ncbi:MAG TPA: RyR domain-containing protein, partial [Jatrophihabitantaceae bacterium]|nr:RyR domain-containing protein [Jatrophihabitantaceae bacterium]
DLHGADPRGADSSRADARGADSRGADPHGALPRGADTYSHNADSHNADSHNADSHNADTYNPHNTGPHNTGPRRADSFGLMPEGAVFDALGGRLRLVDVTEHGCDPRVIDQDLAEWLARSCHLHYLATGLAAGAELGSSAAMVPWEQLSHDYREANRDQVSDIGRKLAAIGCVVSPRRRDVRPFAYSRDEVERLAVLEHERWMAEHRRRGWKFGDVRDELAKTHPAMVDWDDLPPHEREKDREAVRQIPGILADAGLSVIRVGPPAARSR